MFLSLLGLYAWTIPAGACFSTTLSLIGVHLLARERLLQSFCVSQGAVLGTLLGIGLDYPPSVTAMILGLVVFTFSELLFKSAAVIREALFGTLLIVLMSLSYMLSVVFPQLEQHLATAFFGDLVTLSSAEAKSVLVIGLLLLGLLWRYWKPLCLHSFDIALYGQKTARFLSSRRLRRFFSIVSVLAIVLSVQWLGFLFTVACLYLPAVISNVQQQRFSSVIKQCMWTPALSVLCGFGLSLIYPILPSVPTIILLMVVFLVLQNPRLYRIFSK